MVFSESSDILVELSAHDRKLYFRDSILRQPSKQELLGHPKSVGWCRRESMRKKLISLYLLWIDRFLAAPI